MAHHFLPVTALLKLKPAAGDKGTVEKAGECWMKTIPTPPPAGP